MLPPTRSLLCTLSLLFCFGDLLPEQDPGAYGQLGLSDLFEMREECLREFGFSDVYRLDKEAENAVALQVLGSCYFLCCLVM
jgi:hypothetical protein